MKHTQFWLMATSKAIKLQLIGKTVKLDFLYTVKNPANSVEQFVSINERVEGIIIKLNNRYKLKILVPTSTSDDDVAEKFYEFGKKNNGKQKQSIDETLLSKQKPKLPLKQGITILKQVRKTGDQVVEFAKRNMLSRESVLPRMGVQKINLEIPADRGNNN